MAAIVPEEPKAAPEPYLDAIGEVLASVRSLLGAAIDGRLARERGLELAFRLHRYWAATNVSEGRFWLSRLLADALPSPGTGHAAYALGYLSYWSGDTAAAERELQAAVEMLAGQPDPYAARALIYLGGLADDMDRGEEALDFVRRSIEAAAPFGIDLQVGAAIGMGCVLAERADSRAAGYAADAIARAAAAARPSSWPRRCRPRPWCAGRSATWRRRAATSPKRCRCWRAPGGSPGWSCSSTAAGIALADGDLEAAIELGTNADVDASDLGIERELPQVRCIVARALLDRGEAEAAAAMARRAIEAARSLTFSFPLAVCLETAALICLRQPAEAGVSSRLLAAAAQIRARGDRPGPPTLRAAVDQARSEAGLAAAGRPGETGARDDPPSDDRAAADLALSALGPAEIGAVRQSAASA